MLFEKKGGDTTISQLETKITELENKMSALECKLASIYCTESTISSQSTQTTTSVNKVAQRAGYEYIDFTTNMTPSGLELSWDSSKFEESLPSGQVLRDIRIVGDTKDRTIINSNKKANTVLLDATAINPQIEIRLKIDSKDEGVYRYDKVEKLLTSENGVKTISVTPTIPTEERVLSITDVNDMLLAKIAELENKIG